MTLTEPLLLESAPLARRLAPTLCREDPDTRANCAWIHGLWQYLRLLGLASTPDYHSAFFARALQGIATPRKAPRILVSGAADYAMPAVVFRAFPEHSVPPEVTVVDQCETPLMLSRWYAERIGVDIAAHRSDLLQFTVSHAFDALCTHSFFSEIPAARRPGIVEQWRQLLRPGGAAILVNRLRPGRAPGALHATSEQVAAFRNAVLESAQSLGASLACDPLELARDAEFYMSRRVTYSIQQDEIIALFEGAGFAIREITCGPLIAAVRHDVTGLTTPGGAEYASVVATVP